MILARDGVESPTPALDKDESDFHEVDFNFAASLRLPDQAQFS